MSGSLEESSSSNTTVYTSSTFEPSTGFSMMSLNTTQCQRYKILGELNMIHGYNTRFQPLKGALIIRFVLSGLVLLVNLIVAAALAKSWGKFRQNIYIFAINIVLCDALLGLVNLSNSIQHLMVGLQETGNSTYYHTETKWFYTIKSAIFLSTEISTAGHTALIALAFNRYVSAQVYQNADNHLKSGSNQNRQTSVLISRKKSWWFSMTVWVVSAVIFIVGLLWNCVTDCSCFFVNGHLIRTKASRLCHYESKCSFLYPPTKSYYTAFCAILFIISVVVITVACVRTIYRSGGIASILPYRYHLNMVREGLKRHAKRDSKSQPSKAMVSRRKNSMQLAYLRNMTHFILFTTLAYVLCRLPANILLVVDSFRSEMITNMKVAQIFGLLALAQSLLSPIIFYLTLHRLKQAVRDLFDVCCIRTVEIKRGPSTMNFPGNSIKLSTVTRSPTTKSVKIQALPSI